MTPLWLWPNLLSLDAPAVAVLWQALIAGSFEIRIAWPARATLGLAVWAVYIADRLLDTAHEAASAPAPRHRFHAEHRQLMTVLLGIALVSAVVLSVLEVRLALVRAGLLTGGAVLLYLATVHHRRGPFLRLGWISKEAVVAALFTGGTMLAPWLRSDCKGLLLFAGTVLLAVCWANLSLIETFEWRRLRRAEGEPPHPSTLAIADRYDRFALAVACYAFVLLIVQPHRGLALVLLAAFTGGFGLFLLTRMQARLSPSAFRVLADTALLSPLCVWPFLPR